MGHEVDPEVDPLVDAVGHPAEGELPAVQRPVQVEAVGDDLLAPVVVVDRVLDAPLVGHAVGQPEQVRDVVQGEPVLGLDLVGGGAEIVVGTGAPDGVAVGEPDRPGPLHLGEPLVEPVVAVPAVPVVVVAAPAEAAPAEAAPAEAAPAEAAAAGIVVVPAVPVVVELIVAETHTVPAGPHQVEGRAEGHAVQPRPAELVGLGIVEIVVHGQVQVQPAARDAHGGRKVRELVRAGLEVVGRGGADVEQVVLLLPVLVLRLGLQDVVHREAHRLPDPGPAGLREVDGGRDHVAHRGQPADLRLEEAVERRVDRHAHGVVFLRFDPLLFGFLVRVLLPGPGVPGLRADLQPAHELLRRAQVERIGEGAYGCLPVEVPGIRAGMGRVHAGP